MYNTDFPDRANLPTTAKLVRSTLIAAASALVLLVTFVLPSEYGVDPVGIGGLLGLKQMGEINVQLASEAASQTQAPVAEVPAPNPQRPVKLRAIADRLAAPEASVQEGPSAAPAVADVTPAAWVASAEAAVPAEPAQDDATWRDEVSFTLTPGEGTEEFEMVMSAGAVANYQWNVDGGVVNHDAHGDGGGQSAKFAQGRSVQGHNGTLQAPFDENHGWFWRNRGAADVVVTLRTSATTRN